MYIYIYHSRCIKKYFLGVYDDGLLFKLQFHELEKGQGSLYVMTELKI